MAFALGKTPGGPTVVQRMVPHWVVHYKIVLVVALLCVAAQSLT